MRNITILEITVLHAPTQNGLLSLIDLVPAHAPELHNGVGVVAGSCLILAGVCQMCPASCALFSL